jgi:hypothetical protein
LILKKPLYTGCEKRSKPKETTSGGTGAVVFTANGEDFVRQGFVYKQGWHITFDKLFVNIVDPTAYQPDEQKGEVVLKGAHWVDLAEGDENAEQITLGTVRDVHAANYQSLRFPLKRAESGEYRGNTIVMIGKASKDDHVNTGSVGFDFFHRFIEGDTVDVSQSEMKNSEGYSTLVEALWTLGHLGEGHCAVSNQSSKGTI